MDRPALLMTRSADSAAAFLDALDEAALDGVEVCVSPLLEIVSLGVVPDLSPYSGVVFTSANAIDLVEKGAGRKAYCVGSQTARRATARGWSVVEVAETADALVERLSGVPAKGPLLHIAGQHRRGEVDMRLTALGMQTDVVEVYDQRLMPLTDPARRLLSSGKRVIVPLFSPRTANHFVQQVPDMPCAIILAISGAVAEQIKPSRVSAVHTAEAPTSDEMRRAVEMMLRKDSLP